MAFFLRAATLQIGPFKYSMDAGFFFDFKVSFYDSDQLTTATITINNLNESSRQGIRKNQPVILNAGYEDDMGVLFVGQVSGCSHKQNGVEWQTEITAVSALDQWLNIQVNKTYGENSQSEDIVRDLLNIFGLEVGVFELVQNITYPRGKICSGRLKDILTEIVVQECKSRLLIRANQIIINNPADGVTKGYLLTPECGLLMHSDSSDSTNVSTPLTRGTTEEDRATEEKTWKRKCLLNYRLGPGDQIQIRSKELNGKFQIIRGEHRGSPTGSWTTEIEFKTAG